MAYTEWFDPENPRKGVGVACASRADNAESIAYFYTASVTTGVQVALATERPLLVSGPSGCGKSTLAGDIARTLDWDYESQVITSRTQAVDLQYKIDYLRRLQDASDRDRGLQPMKEYVTAGVLWRAFDPEAAKDRRGSHGGAARVQMGAKPPQARSGVVVLIDEIDKADPDVPNNLLEQLGVYRFSVPELENAVVEAQRTPLLVITTNNERRLPDAFIRRCVEVSVTYLGQSDLKKVAERHFAAELSNYASEHSEADLPGKVFAAIKSSELSTAEFLDTLRAILNMNIPPGDSMWKDIANYTVRKPAKAAGGA